MSTAFWIELLLALLAFAGAIVFVLKFKENLQRRAKAKQLRKILIPELQAVLPALAAQLFPNELGADSYRSNSEAIGRFNDGLKQLLEQSVVMFAEERAALSAFSSGLELLLPSLQSGELARNATDELVLLGQRAVHEMVENGY